MRRVQRKKEKKKRVRENQKKKFKFKFKTKKKFLLLDFISLSRDLSLMHRISAFYF
jgi:hypothetical protein